MFVPNKYKVYLKGDVKFEIKNLIRKIAINPWFIKNIKVNYKLFLKIPIFNFKKSTFLKSKSSYSFTF